MIYWVYNSHFFRQQILFLTEQGIMNGTGSGRFSPDASMTREMFVALLGRVSESLGEEITGKHPGFSDVANDEWYTKYISWAVEKGIVMGCGDGTFGLGRYVTKEEAATLIMRYVDYLGINPPVRHRFSEYFLDTEDISDWAYDSVVRAFERSFFPIDVKIDYEEVPHRVEEYIAPQRAVLRYEAADMIFELFSAIGNNASSKSVSLVADGKAYSPYANFVNSYNGEVYADGFRINNPGEISGKPDAAMCLDGYSVEITGKYKSSPNAPIYTLYNSENEVIAKSYEKPPSLPFGGSFVLCIEVVWIDGEEEYETYQYFFWLTK